MSGIVGIINLDGAPVDRDLLRHMTDFMAYRGPDAQSIWVDGSVGFGHAMLRTTYESQNEYQPFSLDGEVWITADARVDGRADLIQELQSKGCGELKSATDVELILHAYHTWGEDCVQHLLGDFAFAIWDGRHRRLFCARDHFGVKPFYYAQVGDCFVFSNTLNCVRIHPAVSDELNDQAIGDFLLFDFNQEPSTTTFADIQRVPPAHYLTWSGVKPRVDRYWTLPIDGRVWYKRASDYVDHFKELLRTAVDDRLRTDRVGVFMSGGLDSTAIAATAHEILSERSGPFDLRAHTIVYDKLIPDEERYYSGLVAESLGISINYLVADGYTLYERCGEAELRMPEPVHNPLAAMSNDLFRQAALHSRIILSGYGFDSFIYPMHAHVIILLKNLRFGRLISDVRQYISSHGRLPKAYFLTRLKSLSGRNPDQYAYPSWLDRVFASRLGLPGRLRQLNAESVPIHPTRPAAYESLTNPFWPFVFECRNSYASQSEVEVRYPFFDLRLVNYMIAIPPVPWFFNKKLLRIAMVGVLPEQVRLRAKTPLAGEPIAELLQRPQSLWLDDFSSAPELAKYVDRRLVPRIAGKVHNLQQSWVDLRPLSLNYWLRHSARVEFKNKPERSKNYEVTRCKTHKADL